ncbi:hypothetical protein [[Mycoplasma] anseris]|uniref:Uncharacterized protein n=1 Tax=[Mycoplasma] anseris TaxID=92400 RepID=A0A2Z4ND62_9BACT|nr:hypothetical protein [[Mycoplasma] anseris]AWX69512.1 hypothetical protein DP065_01970 [[Mycoplasma] anseris]
MTKKIKLALGLIGTITPIFSLPIVASKCEKNNNNSTIHENALLKSELSKIVAFATEGKTASEICNDYSLIKYAGYDQDKIIAKIFNISIIDENNINVKFIATLYADPRKSAIREIDIKLSGLERRKEFEELLKSEIDKVQLSFPANKTTTELQNDHSLISLTGYDQTKVNPKVIDVVEIDDTHAYVSFFVHLKNGSYWASYSKGKTIIVASKQTLKETYDLLNAEVEKVQINAITDKTAFELIQDNSLINLTGYDVEKANMAIKHVSIADDNHINVVVVASSKENRYVTSLEKSILVETKSLNAILDEELSKLTINDLSGISLEELNYNKSLIEVSGYHDSVVATNILGITKVDDTNAKVLVKINLIGEPSIYKTKEIAISVASSNARLKEIKELLKTEIVKIKGTVTQNKTMEELNKNHNLIKLTGFDTNKYIAHISRINLSENSKEIDVLIKIGFKNNPNWESELKLIHIPYLA